MMAILLTKYYSWFINDIFLYVSTAMFENSTSVYCLLQRGVLVFQHILFFAYTCTFNILVNPSQTSEFNHGQIFNPIDQWNIIGFILDRSLLFNILPSSNVVCGESFKQTES